MINLKKNNERIFSILLFSIIFVTGLYVFRDYGVNLDDEAYRQNGLNAYNYIKNFFSTNNKSQNLLIWPTLYEILLAFCSDLFSVDETNKIYHLSHLLNFLIFFIALLFFYQFVKNKLNSSILAYIAVITLFLTPRIFAESFYNSRDIFFLSLFIFNIFSSFNFLNKPNKKNLIFYSLTSALLIDAKIVGIVPVIIFLSLYIYNSFSNAFLKIKDIKLILTSSTLILFFSYILWPYLWSDPVNNFILSFKNNITEQNTLAVINYYFGKYISSLDTPWHYRIVWLLITVPVTIIVFFLIGFIHIAKMVFKRLGNVSESNSNIWKNKNEMFDFYLFTVFFSIFFLTTIFNTSQFGGWRHLYFTYPILILFSMIGMNNLILQLKKKIFEKIIVSIIFLNLTYLAFWNVINHPHQQVYFNLLSKAYAKNNFDLDYWGLSNLYSMKYIANNNQEYPLKVGTVSFASLEASLLILENSEIQKFKIIHDLENADFLISNYMKRVRKNFNIDNEKYIKYFEIIVDGVPINTVYKKVKK